ncbi:hypothetical protein L218DRAFT_138181 [Marasmius fiardii PR-910]|nr:hypothetical protein L218DRAFT_138181 [Marasmius fiardii PR-910]
MPILSWFTWLPSLLPTSISHFCSLPSNIKDRFIRYACKKFILEFLNPGQVNEDELDAQIESDFVQFHDIQLNHTALNNLLPSLPFALKETSIKSASLKLFSRNATFPEHSLTVHSPKFIFHILPPNDPSFTSGTTLPDLVHSYAADFVQPQERARSFHSESGRGGVNIEGHLVAALTNLARLILCDIQFDATDMSISLVFPGQCSFTVLITETSVRTEQGQEGDRKRKADILGITVQYEDFSRSRNSRATDDDRTLLSCGRDPVTIVISEVSGDKLQLSTSIGSIGVTAYSWHVAGLIQVLDACLSHHSWEDLTLLPSLVHLEIDVLLDIQGIVILLCGSSTPNTRNLHSFLNDSFVPPRSPDGYVHIKLDSLSMQHTFLSTAGTESIKSSCNLYIRECTVFGFRTVDDQYDAKQTSFPILITDRDLPSSYGSGYTHCRSPIDPRKSFALPELEVNDWTDEDLCSYEPDPPVWRTKTKTYVAGRGTSQSPDTVRPAFALNHGYASPLPRSGAGKHIHIHLVPLRIFLDLSGVLNDKVMDYLDEILEAIRRTATSSSSKRGSELEVFEVTLTSPLIRFEIRCTLSGLPTRSGALVVDVHDIYLVHYPDGIDCCPSTASHQPGLIFSISARSVLVACSSANRDMAFTVLSIGSHTNNHRPLPTESKSNKKCPIHRRNIGGTWFGIARTRTPEPPRLTLLLNFELVTGRFSGQTLDDVQFWLLDASYLIDVYSDSNSESEEDMNGPGPLVLRSQSSLPRSPFVGTSPAKNPKDIYRVLADFGRCFFIRRKLQVAKDKGEALPSDFETVIKISVDEGMIQFLVPITDPDSTNVIFHSLDISVSVVDAKVVFRNEGTDCQIEAVQLTGENRISSTESHEFFSVRPLNVSYQICILYYRHLM